MVTLGGFIGEWCFINISAASCHLSNCLYRMIVYSTMMWGAERRTAMVVMTVNVVNVIKQNLDTVNIMHRVDYLISDYNLYSNNKKCITCIITLGCGFFFLFSSTDFKIFHFAGYSIALEVEIFKKYTTQ